METLPMHSKVRKVGNTTGVLLSKKILAHYGIKEGDEVEIIVKKSTASAEIYDRLSRFTTSLYDMVLLKSCAYDSMKDTVRGGLTIRSLGSGWHQDSRSTG